MNHGTPLRRYKAPWKGRAVLACRKCQRRLRRADRSALGGRLGQALKNMAKEAGTPSVSVIAIGCQGVCPRRGVVVCAGDQFAGDRQTVSIVRSDADVEALFHSCASIGGL